MQSPGREPSMEEILASIKKVIAEEKELRTGARPVEAVANESLPEEFLGDDDVLEFGRRARAARGPRSAAGRRECCRAKSPGARAAADDRRHGPRAAAGQPARGDGARDAAPDPQAMARRESAADGRRACEAGNHADHGAPALVLPAGGFATPRVMTRFHLLLAAAAVALAASPAAARPMTAVDLQSIHRLGSPAVSPDGSAAVFTVSDTDWTKNKRVNTLHRLDLTRPARQPQPIAGAHKGHDAIFSGDGTLWFLMPVGEHDQLFRMAPGGAAGSGQQLPRRRRRLQGLRRGQQGRRLGRSRPSLHRPRLRRDLPTKPKTGSGGPTTSCSSAIGIRGQSPACVRACSPSRSQAASSAGDGVPIEGQLVGDTPSKPFGGGEEIAFSPDGRTVYFALREAGRTEELSTNLDIFAGADGRQRSAANLTDANDATDNLPTVSPDGRTLAYVAMARPGYESDRQVLMLRDLASGQVRAADPAVGPLGRLDRVGEGGREPPRHRRGHARKPRLPRRRRERRASPASPATAISATSTRFPAAARSSP